MLSLLTALHVCLPRHSDHDAPRANKESNNGDDRSDQQLMGERLRDSHDLLHKYMEHVSWFSYSEAPFGILHHLSWIGISSELTGNYL
jgi:hypothetical protein